MGNIISKKIEQNKEWTQEEMDNAKPVPMPNQVRPVTKPQRAGKKTDKTKQLALIALLLNR